MDNVTVGLIGPLDWARSVGKETSDTSFGVSAIKKDDQVVNIVYPSKYPEKVWSLLFMLHLSDRVYLKVERLDRELGETLIALDLLQRTSGCLALDPGVDREKAISVLRGTVVEGYNGFDPNPAVFREELTCLAPASNNGPTRIVVDQCFNVKGVGCVALGFVRSGTVARHQELGIAPGNKTAQVRSIQVQDRDLEKASAGARVGLALKGVAPENVPRGCCLHSVDDRVLQGTDIRMTIRPSRFWKEPIAEGARLHMNASLQFVPMTVGPFEGPINADGSFITIVKADSPVWYTADELFSICYLDSRSFRVIASGKSF